MPAKITCRLKNGKVVSYHQPKKCPIPEKDWETPLGYCWGLAIAVDNKKRRSFIKNHCIPEECVKYM